MENPKNLYLAFNKGISDCIGYTSNKKIIKQYIKERSDDYYYMIVEKHDIPRVMEYLQSGHSIAEELEPYTEDPTVNIRNIMTYGEYEMFWDSFSYFLPEIDSVFNELDNILKYFKLTDREKRQLRYLFFILYNISDDNNCDKSYNHLSDVAYNEEKAIAHYIKNNL